MCGPSDVIVGVLLQATLSPKWAFHYFGRKEGSGEADETVWRDRGKSDI